jgi:hypothetical protein
MIDKSTFIEDLVRKHPSSVRFLSDKGIKCIACGEPIWGTLEEAAREKGFSPEAINRLMRELNDWIAKS